mmetsp:Transcript_31942/g.5793  ORF Transcript_31942/g.5793 Transcript_31942/m.5793 type:complete len:105 (+) Transcript_31942:1210-1524(+)
MVKAAYKNDKQEMDKIIFVIDCKMKQSNYAKFVGPPSNYVEDDPIPKKASIKGFKLIIKRIERMKAVIGSSFQKIDYLMKWRYPKFTAISLAGYVIMVCFFPIE